jgi:hypothetical protein
MYKFKLFIVVAMAVFGIAPFGTATSGNANEEAAGFLSQLTGDWAVVTEARPGPEADPIRLESCAQARLLGDRWLVVESSGETAMGGEVRSILTIGHVPGQNGFAATFISSMQSHLWSYTGELDSSSGVLLLETEGPIFGNPQKTTRYQLRIETRDADQWIMRSRILGPGGKWFEYSEAKFQRGKQVDGHKCDQPCS